VTPEELVRYYPHVFHMAEAGSWPSIQQHGLLSTSALLDLFELDGTTRTPIEESRRPSMVEITHPIHGTARIRDQGPLHEERLRSCLTDMTPTQWYRLLNDRVFFWLTEERLIELLCAKAYRDREHDVLVVDTAALLASRGDAVLLSPINSGATIYNAPKRGSQTFLPLESYPFSERRKAAGRARAIAELAVSRGIADVEDVTLQVARRKGKTITETLFQR